MFFRYDRLMHVLRVMFSLVVAGGLCALSGCFFRAGTVAGRFSGEFVCPEKQVKVEQISKERFRATGCNRRATYTCSGEYGELCKRIGQPETINPNPEDAPEASPPGPGAGPGPGGEQAQ